MVVRGQSKPSRWGRVKLIPTRIADRGNACVLHKRAQSSVHKDVRLRAGALVPMARGDLRSLEPPRWLGPCTRWRRWAYAVPARGIRGLADAPGPRGRAQ